MSNDSKIIFLGSVYAKLLANGYTPCSAVDPDPKSTHYHRLDEPAAVLCDSICTISVCVADAKVRAAVLAVVHKYAGKAGPVRISSDGSETFIVRPEDNSYGVAIPHSRATKPFDKEHLPAVALDGQGRTYRETGETSPSGHVRLSAPSWRNGDLVGTARKDLPVLDDADKLFSEVERILSAHEPKVEYTPPTPRMLTAEQKAAIAEDERLDAEMEKRNDPEILQEVEMRVAHLCRSAFGSQAYERAVNQQRAKSRESRISIYDQILKERAEVARRESRRRSA